MAESVRLKNDGKLRKQLFVEDAMAHPAKGHIGMWQAIIEKYTKEGDWILDPMAGIGTSLVAALMGRNVICNEMEQHFVDPMKASWAKMQQHPMLGYEIGEALIVRGDARFLPLSSADSIITSPPYEEALGHAGEGNAIDQSKRLHSRMAGNRYTRPVDAVISSPPYANRLADTYVDDDPQRMSYEMGIAKIDAVVSSPPYAGSDQSRDTEFIRKVERDQRKGSRMQAGYDGTKPDALGNIGNQKGDAYWESMKAVYQECHRILKPGGIMALVLKGFTRDGKYIDLPTQTQEMCESLGFVKFGHWRRELWSLSFWRILQQRRDPAAFDDRLKYEEVLVFHKPGENGDGIEAVITSPPWEQSSAAGHDNNTDWFDNHPEIAKKGGGTVQNRYATGYTRTKDGG